MYLSRLSYYSINRISDLGLKVADELKAIIGSCKQNNPTSGLSGALLFSDKYFAQILEGDRKAVTETFCRISQDKRHSDIVILQSRPIDVRTFTDWSMAFAGHSELAEALYNKYSTYNEFNPAKMTAGSLERLMEEIVEAGENTARVARAPGA